MTKKHYSPAIIQQAKSLWEDGTTQKKIAKQLGIQRVNTISEWRRKFEWKRIRNFAENADQKKTWEEIAKIALQFLQDGTNFKSIKDALIVYERSIGHLEKLKIKHKKIDSKDQLTRILSGEANEEDEADEIDGIEEIDGLEEDEIEDNYEN